MTVNRTKKKLFFLFFSSQRIFYNKNENENPLNIVVWTRRSTETGRLTVFRQTTIVLLSAIPFSSFPLSCFPPPSLGHSTGSPAEHIIPTCVGYAVWLQIYSANHFRVVRFVVHRVPKIFRQRSQIPWFIIICPRTE